MALTVEISGTSGSVPVANVLPVFCRGFFATGAQNPGWGEASTDRKPLDTLSHTVSQSFSDVVLML